MGSNYKYKEYLIPKKGGNLRKIVAPNKDLLEYQQKALPVLEGLYNRIACNYGLDDISHGFRSGKNCVTAAEKHIGFDLTIMMDISNFFDSVTYEHVKDYMEYDSNFFHNEGYAAQGFATSPIISNIAILKTIRNINNDLQQMLKEYAFTMYADDIQISFNRKDKTVKGKEEQDIIDMICFMLNNDGFNINDKKTRIRYAEHGYRKILGINVGDYGIRATRRTMRKIRAASFQGNYHSKGGLISWSHCNKPKKNTKNIQDLEGILNDK